MENHSILKSILTSGEKNDRLQEVIEAAVESELASVPIRNEFHSQNMGIIELCDDSDSDKDGNVQTREESPMIFQPSSSQQVSECNNEKFKCDLCAKGFSTIENLQFHTKFIHDSSHQCDYCNQTFEKLNDLTSHIQNVHDSKKDYYKCNKCDKSFLTFESQKFHEKFNHKSKEIIDFKCNSCEAAFTSKELLEFHNKLLHKKSVQDVDDDIMVVNEQASTSKKLLHKKSVQDVDDDLMIVNEQASTSKTLIVESIEKLNCEHCDKSFIHSSALIQHMKKAHETKKCKLCSKTFKDGKGLALHVTNDHKLMRNHKCEKCGKTFFSSINLKFHINRIHNGISTMKCEHCAKEFEAADKLKFHILQYHNPKQKQIRYVLMSSHEMSITTIFVHKHFKQKFRFFRRKILIAFDIDSYLE